jgi:hypothetical protein
MLKYRSDALNAPNSTFKALNVKMVVANEYHAQIGVNAFRNILQKRRLNMRYVERHKLIDLLKNADSTQELIDLFSNEDFDTEYQEYYDTESVKLQIHEASRVIGDCHKKDSMYLIVDYNTLNTIINNGGAGTMDMYSDTRF